MGSILRILLSSSGRMNRKEYATSVIMTFVILIMLIIITAIYANKYKMSTDITNNSIVCMFVFQQYISIVSLIKRLHDIDQSGVMWLVALIPIVGVLLYVFVLFVEGTAGGNRYGSPSRFFEPRIVPKRLTRQSA